MSKKKLLGEAMKHSLRVKISLFAVLLVATTVSLTSVGSQQPRKPWWETRLPGPDECKKKKCLDATEEGCRDFGGQVGEGVKDKEGVPLKWCVGGKYDRCLISCAIPLVPLPTAELSRYPTEEERLAQRERNQRAADRVSTYANSIKCPAC